MIKIKNSDCTKFDQDIEELELLMRMYGAIATLENSLTVSGKLYYIYRHLPYDTAISHHYLPK